MVGSPGCFLLGAGGAVGEAAGPIEPTGRQVISAARVVEQHVERTALRVVAIESFIATARVNRVYGRLRGRSSRRAGLDGRRFDRDGDLVAR
jgi:hypothetical protein